MTDQNNLSWHFPVMNAYVLEQTHMHRIVEEWMEVEQHINTGFAHSPNVLQHIGRFGVDGLRFERDIEALAAHVQQAWRHFHAGEFEQAAASTKVC